MTSMATVRGALRIFAGCSVVLWSAVAPGVAGAQNLAFEVMGGSGFNVPMPLTIQQAGYPDIRFTAHYATKPLGPYAPYYSWRFSLDDRYGAWEVQHLHHRLFLSNTTPEVESFAVHYGYNFFLLGRSWRMDDLILHASGGVIVTSPAGRIRGQTFNSGDPGILDVGYDLSGTGASVAASRNWNLSKHVFVLMDVALLAGKATVPIADGTAKVPNLSFHGHVGIGIRVPRPF